MSVIQDLVHKEGRTARNLVSWNVPFDGRNAANHPGSQSDRPARGGGQARGRGSRHQGHHKANPTRAQHPTQDNAMNGYHHNPAPSTKQVVEKESGHQKDGQRKMSGGDRAVKARYWAFLVENMNRAVDALYAVCEEHEQVDECGEIKMMLENYVKDFDKLADRIKVQQQFEKSQQRPSSISWEVRKSSPMKSTESPGGNPSGGGGGGLPPRQLAFSWADRVKSIPEQPNGHAAQLSVDTVSASGDTQEDSGWETYSRSKTSPKQPLQKQHHINQRQNSVARSDVSEATSGSSLLSPNPSSPAPHTQSQVKISHETAESNADFNTPVKSPGKHQRYDDRVVSGAISYADMESELLEVDTEQAAAAAGDKEDSVDSELDECYDRAIEECEEEVTQLVHQLEDISLSDLPGINLPIEDDDEEGQEGLWGELVSGLLSKKPQDAADPSQSASDAPNQSSVTWEEMVSNFESSNTHASWADLVEEQEEFQRRDPGRALQIHQRLSSPSRTSSWAEKKSRHEEKQRKAEELRARALEETMTKQRNLALRIQEVRRWKAEIVEKKKQSYQEKLKLAEQKRKRHLQDVVRKAHEEENKVNEILFINTLEAQNKRAEMKSKHQTHEARKQEIEDERLRKLEETRALEEAAKERRRQLEAEKEARLNDLQTRREQRMEKIQQLMTIKDSERQNITKTREEVRVRKLSKIEEQKVRSVEELQKKIAEKQHESSARYASILAEKKGRAAELGSSRHSFSFSGDKMPPRLEQYACSKLCCLCKVQLRNEVHFVSHLRGKKHLEAMRAELGRHVTESDAERLSAKYIVDVTEEQNAADCTLVDEQRLQNLKRKLKKIRTKMSQRAKEFEVEESKAPTPVIAAAVSAENKSKMQRALKELSKLLQQPSSGVWPDAKVAQLDRYVGDLLRLFSKNVAADKDYFRSQSGFAIISRVLVLANDGLDKDGVRVVPEKSISKAASLMLACCSGNFANCRYVLYSNKLSSIVDVLNNQFCVLLKDLPRFGPSNSQPLPERPVVTTLASLISTVLDSVLADARANQSSVVKSKASGICRRVLNDPVKNRLCDAVSYMVCCGLVDRVSELFHNVRNSVYTDEPGAHLLTVNLRLLSTLTSALHASHGVSIGESLPEDSTLLVSTLQVTELAGALSLLYGTLLHSDVLQHDSSDSAAACGPAAAAGAGGAHGPLPEYVAQMAVATLSFINVFALLDIRATQAIVAEESLSLQFRHICSYLFWQCSRQPPQPATEALLHEVILAIGYFVLFNQDNQLMVQAGSPPTLLQQMCALPFHYFSDPAKVQVLIPTLVASCLDNPANKSILEKEITSSILASFLKEELEKWRKLQNPTLNPSEQPEKADEEISDEGCKFETWKRIPVSSWEKAIEFFSS